jgi:phage gp46-like protein
MEIRIRDTEACEPQPQLLWDTIWYQRTDAAGGYGDWILARDGDQVESLGGLRAEAALHTATLLSLFTDAPARPDDVLPANDGDRRGWWGDSVPIDGEPTKPIGSRLWLLERAVLTDQTAAHAKDYAQESLATLVEQGAVASTKIETWVDRQMSALFISVEHYSRTGEKTYSQKFGVLWQQSQNGARMNYGDTVFA